VANAPTFGARTQSVMVWVLFMVCRAAALLLWAAWAWVVMTAAAINAADMKMTLVICFLPMTVAKKARPCDG